jgi:hypothetical protein
MAIQGLQRVDLTDTSTTSQKTRCPPTHHLMIPLTTKNARRDRNRKRNERHRRLQEALPIRNLNEALDQVANRVHTTPE